MSESWFYKWRDKPTTARAVRCDRLAEDIRRVFDGSGGTYGSPKIRITLVREGRRISVNTVAKVMAELGLTHDTATPKSQCLFSIPGFE